MKTYTVNFSVKTEVDRERFFQDMANLFDELNNPFADYEFVFKGISPQPH